MLLYILSAEVLASFADSDERINEIQFGDHEIKIANFVDNTSIYLRGITCLSTGYK